MLRSSIIFFLCVSFFLVPQRGEAAPALISQKVEEFFEKDALEELDTFVSDGNTVLQLTRADLNLGVTKAAFIGGIAIAAAAVAIVSHSDSSEIET